MRIGIYGGSFNPIHNGHTTLAKALCDQQLVDELWFVVSPLNPFKLRSNDLLDDEARLSLAQLATKGDERLKVSDVELLLPRPSYMIHTLDFLRKAHTEHEFVLIIGADNWERFPQWKDSKKILRRHRIIIYPRPGFPINADTLPKRVSLVDTPLIDLSSTAIRQGIARGDYDGEGLSPLVWEEIKKKGYYL